MGSVITDKEFLLSQNLNVQQQFIEGKGRCLFATVAFKKGDTVFEEDPLISCQFAWNKTYEYQACDYCMRPLETVEENINRLTGNKCSELPYLELDPTLKSSHRRCSDCGEMYCSEFCRIKAWEQYHQLLCYKSDENEPFFELVECWKRMHYPPETMSIMLLARLVATIHLAENKESMYNTFMQFCHQSSNEDEVLTHNLLNEKYQCDIDVIWSIFSTTMRTRCDNNMNPFTDALLSREGFISMLSLIGRNGQGIGTSVLAEWSNKILSLDLPDKDKTIIDHLIDNIYSQVENHVGTFVNNEGTGLYVIQSCINHSCAPNAKIAYPFNSSRLALLAKRDILPGEEIFITYLDKCSRKRSCHSRRKILREHYLFTCVCLKCTMDSVHEPDMTSEDEEDGDSSDGIDM